MSAAFTPGPWVATGNGIHKGHRCVALTHMEPKEQRDADARLIAAAPDLLAALTRLCRAFPTDADMKEAGWEGPEIEEGCNAYDAARAAIAKATEAA